MNGAEAGHGHGHGHHPGEDDWAAAGARLEAEAQAALGSLEEAARWLAELTGDRPVRRILDLGSGPGVASCVLASAFPDAAVTAVDGSAPLLEQASARAARLGLDARVVVARCDLPDGLESLEPADLVWASRVVHHVGDQVDTVHRMAGLLRPGGVLALTEGGLAQRSLPRDIGLGRPGLQQRLDSALQDWFAEMRAELPGTTAIVEHWPAVLAGAGLSPCGTRSFLVDRPAPLDAPTRAVVAGWWDGMRDRVADRLSAQDRDVLDRLLDPQDEEGLHRRPDVFLLAASTVHAGRAPDRRRH